VTTLFLGGAACATLFLGIVGIYAVISYTVVMRTHEIGIRLALGAQVERVIGMIVRQNMVIVLIGLVAGTLAASGLARFIETTVLFVDARQPMTIGAVGVLMLLVAYVATYVPARKVSRIEASNVLNVS
jgi:putative ABC transport system permease protein